MRQRLQKFLPIVLLALAIQVLAPIAACWAAVIAVSDPFRTALICHDGSAPAAAPGDPADHRPHDGICSICCLAHASVALDTPPPAMFATPFRRAERTIWHDQALHLEIQRTGSNTQARAPPQLT